MRWKTPPKTKQDTERVARYFAFFPTELDDGYTVWLEGYYAKECWEVYITNSYLNSWRTARTSIFHPDDPGTGSGPRRG